MDSHDSPTDEFAHGGKSYLNNASVSIQPLVSINAMTDFVTKYCSMGPDSKASEEFVAELLASARKTIAKIINAKSDEIILTQSTTEGVNMVSRGLDFPAGSNVVIRGATHEHHSNYYAWLRLSPRIKVHSTPIDSDGLIKDDALEQLINSNTRLVALSHALYNTGAILPIKEIGAQMRSKNIPFFVDAAQTVGCMEKINVHELGCDFMSFNGSKWLCGPMGTGILYCRKGSEDLLEPLQVAGSSATIDQGKLIHNSGPEKFEAGFRNYVGIAGMISATQYLEKYGFDKIRQRVISLANKLRDTLLDMSDVTVYGPDDSNTRTSIVPFSIAGYAPETVVKRLEIMGIILAEREILDQKIVRASPHIFNTDSQIDSLTSALSAL